MHTAEAQLRDVGNYFGPALNRCARLRAAAHGAQVVLSRATRDLVLDRLPDGVELADLGMHRLRDLHHPEHVFGMVHCELPADFPPLRSLDILANNLPGELTSFVGRRAELAQVGELLKGVRLLTLTGAGGCGKIRLALQASAEAVDDYPDVVGRARAAARRRPGASRGDRCHRCARAAGWGALQTLIACLSARRALLVVHNCEHLIAACAELADALLRGCPLLTMLATSWAPLEVRGETPWRVCSLGPARCGLIAAAEGEVPAGRQDSSAQWRWFFACGV
ncbi:MAG: hypothetical protein ACRDS0_21150 [Pseudonocardiaceae bacterium]